MKSKKKYPELYKWAYATKREEEIISNEIRNSIPKQTKSNWRKISSDKIFNLEKEMEIRDQIDLLVQKEDKDWIRKKRMFHSISKLHFRTIQLYGKERFIKILSSNKLEFVELIEEFSNKFPRNSLLKWFQISPNRYEKWYTQVKFNCRSSQSLLCAKKHPFQITKNEFMVIKNNLQDDKYAKWAKSAVHSELLKTNKLNISRSTFYKHAKHIRPANKNNRYRKPKYTPLRAEYVNEYWHMDLSYFRTRDGEWNYVYAMLDNYSRKLISWRCEKRISNAYICALIEEALRSASIIKLNLISDGGKENFNEHTQFLIKQYNEVNGADVKHFRSLKDIRQSNSMIERFFRSLKYNYLFVDIPQNYEELCVALKSIVHDYNHIRPHHANKHLTPDEAYRGLKLPDLELRLKNAQLKRLKRNKNCPCTVCDCGG
ncbi:MAG: DDE-type integrase/transposase/recombinase [Bacteroidia bacterium]|jgi:transposase InsO family protein